METIVENDDKSQTEASNQTMLKRAALTSGMSDLNIGAKSFHPLFSVDFEQNKRLDMKIPLNSDIWKCISACSPRSCRETKSIIKPQTFVGAPIKYKSIPRSTSHRLFSLNISSDGLIHIFRSDNIHIQISLDQAIYVTCPDQNIHFSVSGSSTSTAIWHPIGRVLQRDSHIDVVTIGVTNKTLRMAKIWFKGISFTTENIPIVYLMDEAGLRTSNDRFVDIKKSQVQLTFSKNSSCGPLWFDEAVDVMHKSVHSKSVDGTETIEINRIRVISDPDGMLIIQRPNRKCSIRINPRKAGVSLTTAHMHCSASLGSAAHLFLRQDERRIHFDGNIFCVRNVGHSAGLDDQNKLSIFNKNPLK